MYINLEKEVRFKQHPLAGNVAKKKKSQPPSNDSCKWFLIRRRSTAITPCKVEEDRQPCYVTNGKKTISKSNYLASHVVERRT